MPVDAPSTDVFAAQLTRDLFAIAKFLVLTITQILVDVTVKEAYAILIRVTI